MGFTGKQALQFKLAYIDAFNRMEEQLRQSPPAELQEQLHGYCRADPAYLRQPKDQADHQKKNGT